MTITIRHINFEPADASLTVPEEVQIEPTGGVVACYSGAEDVEYRDLAEFGDAYGLELLQIDKYADPTEGYRTALTLEQAAEVAREDGGLLLLTDARLRGCS